MAVYVIGYMASGKTTLGRQLADRLGFRFLDMDEMIELSSGYSISDLFEKFGEAAFRQKERDLLLAHLKEQGVVIATGGGTPCFSDNMDLMNENGITVFLDTGIGTILSRLQDKIQHRPLLNKIPKEQLPAFIAAHLESRRKFYETARIHISGNDPDLEELLEKIKPELKP